MIFYEMQDEVNEIVGQYVDKMESINAADIGLDIRAGYSLLINVEDGVIGCLKNYRSSLDYYGGFEYVESVCIEVLGDYVFYTGGGRVEDCIEHYKESKEIV